ncbi:hypothetical protein PRIPAC_95567 [Pristionchus pacificus]|uniref:G protein-coupled receptor n=1 Tax=Pristionchus pacificus TaxID=54126 RepID=A0A2A6B2F6_PRIPA|nr:hypothetical protein PRIPAC_95567 [Pristionchus pacificus]|eukprot:PDM60051.1 G protein-coupled receptor [Pristionchus pacificus]
MKNESSQDDSIMGVITSTFCDVRLNITYFTPEDERTSIEQLQYIMSIIMTIFCVIGIGGNILNIKTLQSSSLQTVPFMYIRTLAVFDLIGLNGVLLNIISKAHFGNSYPVMWYKAHLEPVLINTFFIGGLYCAFMLTLERSLLISRPHYRQSKPRRAARRRIFAAFIISFILHIPLGLQFHPVEVSEGFYIIGNNVELLCDEPMYTFFYYYKFVREGIRLATVVLMAFLNILIAHKLHETSRRRREMVCQRATTASILCSTASASARSSIAATDARSYNYSTTTGGNHGNNPSFSSASSSGGRQPRTRNDEPARPSAVSSLYRSFTEKKLTVLMAVICVIYMLGNLPQMIIMSVQDESKEGVWKFQILRQVGNMLEVGNHCVNFYLFCLASSEYSRAFANSCSCFRNIAARVPFLKRFAQGPFLAGASVVSINAPREMVTGIELGDMSNSSGGRKISTIPNEAALSASQEDNLRKVSSEQGTSCGPSTSQMNNVTEVRETDEEERKPLRGILINSSLRLSSSLRSSGIRQKRSLTIANEAETTRMRDDVDDDGIEKVEASV